MIPTSQTCLLATHQLQKIAAPLFDLTDLNFFSYARDFDINRSISLQTDNELFFAWFESGGPYCSFVTPDGAYDSHIFQYQTLQESARSLNHGNGIQIFKRNDSFSEIITLAAPDNMNVLQFYINNISLVNKFIMYFKDRAANLIKGAMNDPIIVPDNMINKVPIIKDLNIGIDDLENIFRTKTFFFNDQNAIRLSKREIECLSYYLKGLTSIQISSLMEVKKVTTDTFLRNIKNKFNCTFRSELFEKFWKLGIIKTNGIF